MALEVFDVQSVRFFLFEQTPVKAFLYTKQGPVYYVNFDDVKGALELASTFNPAIHELGGSGLTGKMEPGYTQMELLQLGRGFKDSPPMTKEQSDIIEKQRSAR